jgi:hypothetical protein
MKTMTKPKYKIGEVVFVKSELDDEKICQGVIKSADTTIDGRTWFYEIYIPLMPSDTKGETIYSYEEDTGDAIKRFIN